MAAPGGAIWDGVIGARKTIVTGYEGKIEDDDIDAMPGVYVWVPLLANGEVMGALAMQRTDQNRFSIQYLSLLESVGKQIGTAVNNAIVYQQVLRSEAHLQGWAQRAQMMVYRANADGTVEYIDLAAVAVTGYTAQELLQNRDDLWAQLVVPQDLTLVAKKRRELRKERDRVAYEYQIVRKGGEVCRIWELDIAVGDVQNGQVGWQGVLLKDVSAE
jgi:PAS domain S-box-containing protein